MPCRKNKTGIKFIGTQFMREYSGTIYFPQNVKETDTTYITFIGQNFKWDKGYKITGRGTLLCRTKLDDGPKYLVIQGMFNDSIPTDICGIVFPNNT